MKESLWQYWLLTFKCQMNFLLKKNPLSTLCQVIGKWTVWQLTNDIDRVPCSSLAPDCRHWCRAKPSSSEGLYGGRPTFFARQSTLFIDLWFFMAACHTTLRSITQYCLDKQTSDRHPSWLNHPVYILTSDHLIERVSFPSLTFLAGGHRHKRPRAASSLHSGEVACSVKNWIMYITTNIV